jgi:hypothetical protein
MDWRPLTLILLLLALTPAAADEPRVHSQIGCDPCHVTNAKGKAAGPISMIHDQERICLPCHDGVFGPTPTPHPMFIPGPPKQKLYPAFQPPNHPLPPQFPLDDQGRVTCSTCHAIHGDAHKLLRDASFWNCVPCHRER